MFFSEPAFLFYFLPAVLIGHSLLRGASRNILLLIASLIFYAWGEPVHILLLGASIALNHSFAKFIDRARTERAKTWLITVGAILNLGALGYFKYRFFAADVLGIALDHPRSDTGSLPLGVSFFTLQGVAYLFDVRRGAMKAEERWWHTALFISLFPQLIAGPILRFKTIAPQLQQRVVGLSGFAYGMRRFIVGFGKKVLIADTLAKVANSVFAIVDPLSDTVIQESSLQGPVAWLGLACFALQLYFDFSGYSDMAIGLGRMFGLRIPENFNFPYISQTVTEFWRRWHISLSMWLRDYLYIPLGGNRCPRWRTIMNLWIVFLLCGLWHGASWNFVCFGAVHGFFLSAERILLRSKKMLPAAYGIIYVNLAWWTSMVFFRSADLDGSLRFFKALFFQDVGKNEIVSVTKLMTTDVQLTLACAIVGTMPILKVIQRKSRTWQNPVLLLAIGSRDLCLAVILLLGAMAVAAGSLNSFWYFRF